MQWKSYKSAVLEELLNKTRIPPGWTKEQVEDYYSKKIDEIKKQMSSMLHKAFEEAKKAIEQVGDGKGSNNHEIEELRREYEDRQNQLRQEYDNKVQQFEVEAKSEQAALQVEINNIRNESNKLENQVYQLQNENNTISREKEALDVA